jgi:hypothetical protein
MADISPFGKPLLCERDERSHPSGILQQRNTDPATGMSHVIPSATPQWGNTSITPNSAGSRSSFTTSGIRISEDGRPLRVSRSTGIARSVAYCSRLLVTPLSSPIFAANSIEKRPREGRAVLLREAAIRRTNRAPHDPFFAMPHPAKPGIPVLAGADPGLG